MTAIELSNALTARRAARLEGSTVFSGVVLVPSPVVTAHPDTPDEAPADVPVQHAADAVRKLDCPFVTVDWALNDEETWRVVEIGDGQVSDRPVSTGAAELLGAVLTRVPAA
jgi:hypothetical protein